MSSRESKSQRLDPGCRPPASFGFLAHTASAFRYHRRIRLEFQTNHLGLYRRRMVVKLRLGAARDPRQHPRTVVASAVRAHSALPPSHPLLETGRTVALK